MKKVAILKHKGYKSANYFSCQQYYLFEHDEITHKPTLDENGNLIPREHVLTAAQNTTWEGWAQECWEVNNKYSQNQKRGDIKSHEYVLSFDPRDGIDHGLTLEKSLELGKEFAAKNFPGHQAVIAAHMPEDGNFDVHICINSTRMYDEDEQDFMKKSCEYLAGNKHYCSHDMLVHLKQSTMDMCRKNGLYQVDLLADRSKSIDKVSDEEYNEAVRGQRKLDEENAKKIANGDEVKVTKYDTQKEELRQAIRVSASRTLDFEEFKNDLLQNFGIEVTESRGKIGYVHPDRNKPTRADKLGAGYSKEAIEDLLRHQRGEPDGELSPEERKADFLLKYGSWCTWREEEYPQLEKLQLPENEVAGYVLQTCQELHTAIRGISEDGNMPEYSGDAQQHVQLLNASAEGLRQIPSAERCQAYIDTLQRSGGLLNEKIQSAGEVNIEKDIIKSFECRTLEMYGRDTRAMFGRDHKDLADIWNKWEEKANIDKMWSEYKTVSDEFWELRSELMESQSNHIHYAYEDLSEVMSAYNEAGYFLQNVRDPLSLAIGTIWIIIELVRYIHATSELMEARREYQQLRDNTADFQSFCRAYRNDLRAGRIPHQKCLDSMTRLMKTLDEEREQQLSQKYGKKTLQAIREKQLEVAKEYSINQKNTYSRKDWKLQQIDETKAYATKHSLNLDNTLSKIEEYGRALGAARREVKAVEEKLEQMKGTVNAAKDFADTVVFAKNYNEMPEGEGKENYYEINKVAIDTFNYAKEVLQKRGIMAEEEVYIYLEDYKNASIVCQKAKKNAEEKKQNYIEVCKFRDNIFKIYKRNGVYLDGFDRSANRSSGRVQTGGREQQPDWRTVAAEAGRADGSRTTQTDERKEGERTGEYSAQKDIDRVQRQVRGVAENVTQSVSGHRADESPAERDDRAEAQRRSDDKQQIGRYDR